MHNILRFSLAQIVSVAICNTNYETMRTKNIIEPFTDGEAFAHKGWTQWSRLQMAGFQISQFPLTPIFEIALDCLNWRDFCIWHGEKYARSLPRVYAIFVLAIEKSAKA